MQVIESRIDTSNPEYRENYQVMEERVALLREEMEKAVNDRSDKARARLAEQNKLPVRKRLELLLDRNTPFLEIAPLAARDMYDGRVHGAGIVSGIGVVEGREVIVHALDHGKPSSPHLPRRLRRCLPAPPVGDLP